MDIDINSHCQSNGQGEFNSAHVRSTITVWDIGDVEVLSNPVESYYNM